jgi:hypothetical protein
METRMPEDKPTARDVWMRGLFMLLFMIAFSLGVWLLNLLAIVQFVWLLVAREPNEFLAGFGNSLAIWLAEIGRFLSCASEEKPFPGRHGPMRVTLPPRRNWLALRGDLAQMRALAATLAVFPLTLAVAEEARRRSRCYLFR